MAKDDDEDLPDKDAAKGFYAKYEPKEILGRLVQMTFTIKLPHSSMSNRTKYIDEKVTVPKNLIMYNYSTT